MSVPLTNRTTPFLFEDMPPALQRVRDIGGLVIGPNSAARRLLKACREGFEDISGCMSESRRHDATHDLHLVNAERLTLRGIQISRVNGCPCAARYQAILRDIKAAQAADSKEDNLIEQGWAVAKRMAGCLCKALSDRQRAGKGQVAR